MDWETRIFVLFLPWDNGVKEDKEGKDQSCRIFLNQSIRPHLIYSTNQPILHGLDLHLKIDIRHYYHPNHWLNVTDDLMCISPTSPNPSPTRDPVNWLYLPATYK